jgi:class 3 adenylate cyclase
VGRCNPGIMKGEVDTGYALPPNGLPSYVEGECRWRAHRECSGEDGDPDCPWRTEEMQDTVYIPPSCTSSTSPCSGLRLSARFLRRGLTQREAVYSILQTTFIVLLLALGSVGIARDTQNLVIAPIEKMVNIVRQLADDPLKKPEVELKGELPPAPGALQGPTDISHVSSAPSTAEPDSATFETEVLERTILKIGGLLQVGFGEAGAQIIGNNFSQKDGELNIMVPGTKVIAVYATCEIRDFDQIAECLMEEVMVFLNKVANIVHSCASAWGGAANKNLGETFLLTWLLDEAEETANLLEHVPGFRPTVKALPLPETINLPGQVPTLTIALASPEGALDTDVMMAHWSCSDPLRELADRSLTSMIKVMAEVRRANDLNAYGQHTKIIHTLGLNYRVDLGFALHVGWSVEGAVGSERKVDASYIGPHVKLSGDLQRITPRYGVGLLLSEPMYQCLSPKAKERCRKVDNVTVTDLEATWRIPGAQQRAEGVDHGL